MVGRADVRIVFKRNGRSERDNITGNRHRERRILSACNTKKEKPLKCGREGSKEKLRADARSSLENIMSESYSDAINKA